ncbi:SurA N-terminal domain-containing protein [Billgrantia gudaonensis]|uniref:Peptidyl-prolyl cis-trans isomerase SurA n=1 Tax=Billgrantia gudaonensis TaxID=376427 RepID=A0A1G8U6V5_9GAMM|nr:SurA N-terminal domain-containing protein [Halomonas gudaonensis]SDJ48845.1 peptidyl-prolyl cis-trans isomerase SurA [Halomonas gudaonensis]
MRSERTTRLGVALALALGIGMAPLTLLAQESESDFQPVARQSLDRIVAVVNDRAIMASELEQRVEQARSQLVDNEIEVPENASLREQMLDRLIVEEIQLQLAEDAGLSVDDTELNRQVRGIAESNGMTLEQFADALEEDGLSLGRVRDEVRRQLLLRELQQRQVGGRVNLTEREVERFREQQGGNVSREQASRALFQRKANEALEAWIQEIRADAFIEKRLSASR